jgi:phosphoribosylglycinamide formyltransferase-1
MEKFNIAIFASGNGSNALNIIRHFQQHDFIRVALVISNKVEAGVLKHARDNQIDSLHFSNATFAENPQAVLGKLLEYEIKLIVLAGFLRRVPDVLVAHFSNRIVNIHPALLPDFGGKGMYGDRVHQAVIDAKRIESGITIHYVDGHYDEGKIIFQAGLDVGADETVDSLQKKIQALEHRWFPEIIESLIDKMAEREN